MLKINPQLEMSLEARVPDEVDLQKYEVRSKSEFKNLKDLKDQAFDGRYVCDRNGKVYLIKAIMVNKLVLKEMKPFLTRDGYLEYVLTTKHGMKKHIQGQRIVAGLYLKSTGNKIYVNHKDLDRTNNKVTNLEWISQSDNLKHSYANNPNRPRVNQYTFKR